MVTATIPLTSALMDNISESKLESLDPSDVEGFLTDNLQYRMTLMDDTEVGNGDVPSLKISIVSAEVALPLSVEEMPVWGDMIGHMDVSTGR